MWLFRGKSCFINLSGHTRYTSVPNFSITCDLPQSNSLSLLIHRMLLHPFLLYTKYSSKYQLDPGTNPNLVAGDTQLKDGKKLVFAQH